MKKCILLILLIIMFIPFCVNAESSIIVNSEEELVRELSSSNNNEITLGRNITLSASTRIYIKEGEHTLNLENFKLGSLCRSDRVPDGLINIMGGTLIVNAHENGLFDAPSIEQNFYIDSGKLIINGGTIKATRDDGACSISAYGGNVYINEGNIIGTILVRNGANVVINDGDFNGYTDAALIINPEANVKIVKGSFSVGDNVWDYGFNTAIVFVKGQKEYNYQNIYKNYIDVSSKLDNPTITEMVDEGFYSYITNPHINITNSGIIKYDNIGENEFYDITEEKVIKIKGDYNKFVSIVVDDVKLKKYDDYIVTGNDKETIITLNKKFIESKDNKNFNLKINYSDGYTISNFKFKDSDTGITKVLDTIKNPNTGTCIYIFFIITIIMIVSFYVYIVFRKRKDINIIKDFKKVD